MKYIYNRVIAYVIDMLLVVIVATMLSKITFINPYINKFENYNKLYSELNLEYQGYVADLQKYYNDSKISLKEYDKLVDKYESISIDLQNYYDDKKIDNKEFDKIISKANKSFLKQNKKLYFDVTRYSLVYNIIFLVLSILYFIGFNIITHGQTLGKKIMGLKLIGIDDKDISLVSYIVRFIILYNPIYYLAVIIGPMLLNVNDFYTLALIISNIKNYLCVIILMVVMFRNDNRGIHDLVCKSKVIRLDNNNVVVNNKKIKNKEN